MRAVVIEEFGPPEVMTVVEVADPEPGPGQVRVAVSAAGTNPVDAGNRLDGTWAGLTLPAILGYDVAGVVDRLGPGTPAGLLGQRVMAMTRFPAGGGGYAELVVLDATLAVPVPEHVSLVEAAAVPLAAGTAADLLSRLRLVSGSSLLVTGASGGVGTFLVQLGAAAGITVVAVGGRRSHDLLRELGAAACVDYTQGSITESAIEANGGLFDAVADLVGGPIVAQAIAAVRPHGQVAGVAYPLTLTLDALFDANLTFHFVLIQDDPARLVGLAAKLDAGTIRGVIAGVFPLEQAPDVHRLLESGHSGGKLVLGVRPENL